MTTQDAHSLAGAYALDALTEPERRRFETHLAECDTCPQELRGLQETAAKLGLAAQHPAPQRLRTLVMTEIAHIRQAPPHLTVTRHRRRSMTRLMSAAAVAACLLAALVLGGLLLQTHNHLDRTEALNRRLTAVISAPDARTVTAPVTTGGNGTAIVSRSQNRAIIAISGLTAIPSTKTYEVWLMGHQPARPAGLIKPGIGPVITNLQRTTTQIGITIEPAGGSPAPTTTPILTLPLPA